MFLTPLELRNLLLIKPIGGFKCSKCEAPSAEFFEKEHLKALRRDPNQGLEHPGTTLRDPT